MKEHAKRDRRKHCICVIIGICTAIILTGFLTGRRWQSVNAKTAEIQEELAKDVFRFHVIANSDSGKDQAVKIAVRDAVLDYMKETMPEISGKSAQETKVWAQEHLEELEKTAKETLEERGFSYDAEAVVTTCYFPEKQYGDITFPEGNYEALRIRLGDAGGQNWWCVLYPNLCFLDATCAVVSDEGKEDLQETLNEEEYEMITASENFKIKWFFFGENTKEK